jgi:hypothetical protein
MVWRKSIKMFWHYFLRLFLLCWCMTFFFSGVSKKIPVIIVWSINFSNPDKYLLLHLSRHYSLHIRCRAAFSQYTSNRHCISLCHSGRYKLKFVRLFDAYDSKLHPKHEMNIPKKNNFWHQYKFRHVLQFYCSYTNSNTAARHHCNDYSHDWRRLMYSR